MSIGEADIKPKGFYGGIMGIRNSFEEPPPGDL
jgi:hypothetical protein